MFKSGNIKKVLRQWGGSKAIFFTYMHFSHDLCLMLLVPLLPLIRAEFGLDYLQAGLLLSAYNVTSGLSQFLGGWLGSQVKQQVIAAVGLAGVGFATLATGLSPAFYPLLFLLLILGVFSGGYHPSSFSMIATHFQASSRGKVVGLHMLGGTLASVIGPVVGGLIADRLNWHFAFILLCLPALLTSSLVFPVLNKFGRQERTGSAGLTSHISSGNNGMARVKGKQVDTRQLWRPVIAVVTLTLLSHLLNQAAVAFIPMYFIDKAQIAAVTAAMFFGILRAGGMAGGLVGGWLTDSLGSRRVVALALIATGPGLYLITRLPVNTFLLPVLVAFGAILTVRGTAVQTFLMDNTPPQITSTVFGIYFGLQHEGSSLTQPVVGYFMDIYGIDPVFNFIALASVGLSLAALFLIIPGHGGHHNTAYRINQTT